MDILGPATEKDMILEFMRAERDSPGFHERVRMIHSRSETECALGWATTNSSRLARFLLLRC